MATVTMEDLTRDPALAPHLVKLLNDKLQMAQKSLEESLKVNDQLRAELTQLRQRRPLGTHNEAVQDSQLQQQLEEARQEIHNLKNEKADLQALVEGCRDTRRHGDMHVDSERQEGCVSTCQAKPTISKLRQQIDGLKKELGRQSALRHGYNSQLAKLRTIATSNDAAHMREKKNATELQDQIVSMQAEFKEKEAKLKQEMEISTQKYYRYKAQFQDCSSTLQRVKSQFRVSDPSQQHRPILETTSRHQNPSTLRSPPSALSSANARPRPEIRQESWFEIVSQALTKPCFPLRSPEAPNHLPSHVLELITRDSVLTCPDRNHIPASEFRPSYERARTLGRWGPGAILPFSGICYAGTFLCTEVGTLSTEEYTGLTLTMQGAIVESSFASRGQFFKTSNHTRDRLEQCYQQGSATVEYLQLRYVGYNKPFAWALLEMGAMEDEADVQGGQKRRSASNP